MDYKVTVRPDHEEYTGDSLEQLQEHLNLVKGHPFLQVWVNRDNGQNMGLFCNRNYAAVLCHDGDGGGAEAHNPDHDGQDDDQMMYLENGEVNDLPKAACIPKREGIRAVLEFWEGGNSDGRLEWLHWHEI